MDSSSFLLLGNAFLLGFRHGLDWDHIAAIMDIVGTTTTSDGIETLGLRTVQVRTLLLSFLYGVGHASAVVLLGVAAIYFASLVPVGLNAFAERAVGFTLLAFGVAVFWVLTHSVGTGKKIAFKSRWMIIFEAADRIMNWLRARLLGAEPPQKVRLNQYGPRTAFGVGLIHGIGVESGTQILIIAAVAGGGNPPMIGVMMLASFVIGAVMTNTLVALLGSTGFVTSARIRPIYITVGALTGFMSLIVGAFLVLGRGSDLPSLGHVLGE